MRKLHLVGLTTDQKGLIFTARRGSDSGGYVVALDADVLNAVARAQGRANGAPVVRPGGEYTPGPGSQTRRRGLLTPREIQARLRAGRSVEDVAEEADVEVEWVERFAVPILAEQAQVVELAQSLVYAKPKVGSSSQPLEESVVWNLLDRGARVTDEAFDASWSAYQLHDQVWVIRFTYRSRGRAQEARWELDVGSGELLARNKVAAELAYVEAGAKPRRPPVEPSDEADGKAKSPSRGARPSTRKAAAAAVSGGEAKAAPALDHADDGEVLDDLDDLEDDDQSDDDDQNYDGDEDGDGDAGGDGEADGDGDAGGDGEAGGDETPVAPETVGDGSDAPVAAGETAATAVSETAADAPSADGPAAAASGARAKAKAAPKPRAKPAGAKAKKLTPDAPPEPPPPPPVRGLLVSSGRVTRPVPPTRGLLVSSPRMRAAQGGIDSPPPAPVADRSAAPSAPEAPTPPAPPAKTAKPGPKAEAADAAADAPRQARSDAPEPSSTPGGAGVRKAVAQVTSVRVAASRALVARAMLPKPAPPVVSRPTLGGRVNQPIQEAPPQPIRSRSREQAARPSEPAAQDGRPALRLQPPASEPDSGAVSPFRRSSRSEEAAPAGGDRERPTDQPRSPFVPRPAPSARPERPAGPRPPAGSSGPVVRPAPRPAARPEPGRPASGRPPARRPEPGRPESGRSESGRPQPGRPEAGRPESGRPQPGRPQPGRPEAGRPEAGRAEPGRPAARRPEPRPEGRRPPERRPNDRRLDDRGRPDEPDVPRPDIRADDDDDEGDEGDDRTGPFASGAGGGRPRIAAPPAGDWRPSGGRQKPPAGPPVVPPPTGIEEPRPRRRLRRPPR